MEESNALKQIVIIVLSFLGGMILEVVPLPHWAVYARPEWVFIILLFWAVTQPQYVGMTVAFCVGILMDLLTGTLLGQHALAFTLVIYIVASFHPQLKLFPLWQQLGIIFMFTMLQLALQCWVLEIIGMLPTNWGYWLPAISSTIIWPWFYLWVRERHETVRGFG